MALSAAVKQKDWLGGAMAGASLGNLFTGTMMGVKFGVIGAVVGGLLGLFGGGGKPQKRPEQLPLVRGQDWRPRDIEWALPVRAPASLYYGGRAGMEGAPAAHVTEVHLHGPIHLPNVRDGQGLVRDLRSLADGYSDERSRGIARNLPSVS